MQKKIKISIFATNEAEAVAQDLREEINLALNAVDWQQTWYSKFQLLVGELNDFCIEFVE